MFLSIVKARCIKKTWFFPFTLKYHINFMLFCLLSHVLVDIVVNIVLFKSAACIDLAYFCQLPFAKQGF